MPAQIDALTGAIEALVGRIGKLRRNEVIRRDLQVVPQAIKDLETRLATEKSGAVRNQLERTLASRRKQLESLEALQNSIKQAEIQIESTLSQLGTIYSQLLTGQSTSHMADYSRLATDIDEEVRLVQDHLEALREVKLDLAKDNTDGYLYEEEK
jgi:gas vesicle protein